MIDSAIIKVLVSPARDIRFDHSVEHEPGVTYWRFTSFFQCGEVEYACVHVEPWFRVKDTPKGFWVVPSYMVNLVKGYNPNYPAPTNLREVGGKLILNDSRRPWAYETKDEAFESFVHRIRKRRDYAVRELERVREIEYRIKNHKELFERSGLPTIPPVT